jgi:hypothetical protein
MLMACRRAVWYGVIDSLVRMLVRMLELGEHDSAAAFEDYPLTDSSEQE